jgi:hypothetical protein
MSAFSPGTEVNYVMDDEALTVVKARITRVGGKDQGPDDADLALYEGGCIIGGVTNAKRAVNPGDRNAPGRWF